MLIAQITDLHLGFEPGNPDERNRQRLDRTLAHLAGLDPLPDLLLATGDLAEQGDDTDSYSRLREALSGLPFPVRLAIGNHDLRAPLVEHFPETPVEDGFVQYAMDQGPLRIVVLDTVEEGRHGGAFCERRADWLARRLDGTPERPTIIVLHHPPIVSGIDWLSESPDAEWIARLRAVLRGRDNLVALLSGHLHRPIAGRWEGSTLIVCPSTAPQVALDLAPIDPDAPDGRPLIVAEAPGYALHWWNGRELVTHFGRIEETEVVARYTARLQPMVRDMGEEKSEG